MSRDRSGATVCEPVTQRDGHPDLLFRNGGEKGPDARLIVAAPLMLAELRRLRDVVGDVDVELIDAVIAEATEPPSQGIENG